MDGFIIETILGRKEILCTRDEKLFLHPKIRAEAVIDVIIHNEIQFLGGGNALIF
jgi:hypothetical protein